MKKYILFALMTLSMGLTASAQNTILTKQGKCGEDLQWSFDGKTLSLRNINKKGLAVRMDDYNTTEKAPWAKKKLTIKSVHVGPGIVNIGSCAFADSKDLTEVVFDNPYLRTIGWGAFMNCSHLRTISLPTQLTTIGTIAFANCVSLTSVRIPDQCRVEDQAFINCSEIQNIEVSPTAQLGQYVFAHEVEINGKARHTLYNGEIRRLPAYINSGNCHNFGISRQAMTNYVDANGGAAGSLIDYDYVTSDLDTDIPMAGSSRLATYALVIGNQNYRFVPNVPYAIHDARVFREYCEKTLGIPTENIHITEDATKQMIEEEEFEWLRSISGREDKKLIVYYAGHGVPDTKDRNKAYMLPTDVRGTKPYHGIALDNFYARLEDLDFYQTTVFLDACFSGVTRDNESVNEGMRGVEIAAEEGTLGDGNIVVFSAAQGNETAQGYQEKGHGLFTYYLLEALNTSSGYVTLGQLSDYMKNNVQRQALQMKLRKPQTPSTSVSTSLENNWRTLSF